jgi:O-methyltransferase
MFKPPENLADQYVYAPLMGTGPFTEQHHSLLRGSWDFVRHGSMGLAALRVRDEAIAGDMAEVGVWRGDCAMFIHLFAPDRTFYLFDTFEGFPDQKDEDDNRFKGEFLDTSEEYVRERFREMPNVIVRKGIFPDTTLGLENNRYCLVSLDCDLYQPILDGWQYFYPRMSPGGYVFLHDHNGLGYNAGPARATQEFLADKPEKIVDLPDQWGSVMIRKL